MAVSETKLKQIQGIIEEFPLAEVLEVAEVVAGFIPIPGLPNIIKVLKILCKIQPSAGKLVGAAGNAMNKGSQEQVEREKALQNLDVLVEIAVEDGEITEEEKKFLLTKARELGLNEDDFMFKVNHLASKNK